MQEAEQDFPEGPPLDLGDGTAQLMLENRLAARRLRRGDRGDE